MTKPSKERVEDDAYREGVRATIPDDLPDGAWWAMMEERGLDPLDDIIDFERPQDVIAFKSESAKQMHIRDMGHTKSSDALARAKRKERK